MIKKILSVSLLSTAVLEIMLIVYRVLHIYFVMMSVERKAMFSKLLPYAFGATGVLIAAIIAAVILWQRNRKRPSTGELLARVMIGPQPKKQQLKKLAVLFGKMFALLEKVARANVRGILIVLLAVSIYADRGRLSNILSSIHWTAVLIGVGILLAIKFAKRKIRINPVLLADLRHLARGIRRLPKIDFLFLGICLVPVVILFIACITFFGPVEGTLTASEIMGFVMILTPPLVVIGIKKEVIGWDKGVLAQWFTTVATRTIVFVNNGKSHWRTYIDSPDQILRNGEMVPEEHPGQAEEEKTFLERKFGRYWVGPAFLGRNVKVMDIPLTEEKEEIKDDDGPEDWVISKGSRPTTGLRERINRSFVVQVRFKGGVDAKVLVNGNFRVKVPVTVGYAEEGKFFPNLVSSVRSGLNFYCESLSPDEFLAKDRTDGGEMSKDVAGKNNPEMKINVGITTYTLSVPRIQILTTEEEDAIQAEKLAQLNGLATIATAKAAAEAATIAAKADAKILVIEAKGQSKAKELLAKASVADVNSLFASYVKEGVNANVAAQESTRLGRSQRFTDKNSPVTTLVENGTTGITLPIEPKRIQPPKSTDKSVETPKERSN